MANSNNLLTQGLQGQIAQQLVFKKYGNKTVVTKFPDMSNIRPSAEQKKKRSRFAEAVAYAKNILYTPELKAAYKKKIKKGQNVYQYALKEFLNKP
jgi:hypothetical protein